MFQKFKQLDLPKVGNCLLNDEFYIKKEAKFTEIISLLNT